MTQSTQIHVCSPVSKEHRLAMRWFSSLTQVADPNPNLRFSVQFYSLYASTGEAEYLQRCEDFLKHSLDGHETADERQQ